MLSKYDKKNYQICIEQFQQCHFPRIKKTAPIDTAGGAGTLGYEWEVRQAKSTPRSRGSGQFKSTTLGKSRGGGLLLSNAE